MRQDERDPLPEPDWQPVSSAWARRQALEAAAAAVTASREKRKKSGSDVLPTLPVTTTNTEEGPQ